MNLSYIQVVDSQPFGIRGAAMITNEYGLPIEFRYSDPVTPTQIQRALFGQSLEHHLIVEVVGNALLQALDNKPDIIIVEQPILLNLAAIAKTPVIRLRQTDNPPMAESGALEETGPNECLIQLSDVSSPFKIYFFDKPNLNIALTLPKLMTAGARMDLIEPLERVNKVLSLVYREKRDQLGTTRR